MSASTLESDAFLHELVDYMLPWDKLLTATRLPSPQQLAEIVAESMDDARETPQSRFIIGRLRNGDANAYIAGRLGLT